MFEILNEPSLKLTTARWSDEVPTLLAAVRETNPTRAVLVGPGNWNQIQELPDLKLPPDPDLILTVHTYEPFEFTHQGATWQERPAADRPALPAARRGGGTRRRSSTPAGRTRKPGTGRCSSASSA